MADHDRTTTVSHPTGSSPLAGLPTPGLLLDQGRFERNVQRMRDHLAELGVRSRPHLKTAKSVEVTHVINGW